MLNNDNNIVYSIKCSKPAGEIIKRHNTKDHCYAGDTWGYMALMLFNKWCDTSSSMEECIEDKYFHV